MFKLNTLKIKRKKIVSYFAFFFFAMTYCFSQAIPPAGSSQENTLPPRTVQLTVTCTGGKYVDPCTGSKKKAMDMLYDLLHDRYPYFIYQTVPKLNVCDGGVEVNVSRSKTIFQWMVTIYVYSYNKECPPPYSSHKTFILEVQDNLESKRNKNNINCISEADFSPQLSRAIVQFLEQSSKYLDQEENKFTFIEALRKAIPVGFGAKFSFLADQKEQKESRVQGKLIIRPGGYEETFALADYDMEDEDGLHSPILVKGIGCTNQEAALEVDLLPAITADIEPALMRYLVGTTNNSLFLVRPSQRGKCHHDHAIVQKNVGN